MSVWVEQERQALRSRFSSIAGDYPLLFRTMFCSTLLLLVSRFDTLARSELSQVPGTSYSSGEDTRLLPAISCAFCNPDGSCIEQSGIESTFGGQNLSPYLADRGAAGAAFQSDASRSIISRCCLALALLSSQGQRIPES